MERRRGDLGFLIVSPVEIVRFARPAHIGVSGFGRLHGVKAIIKLANWKSWVKLLSFSGIITTDKAIVVEKTKNTRTHYGFE
jgi:hypothetical protein